MRKLAVAGLMIVGALGIVFGGKKEEAKAADYEIQGSSIQVSAEEGEDITWTLREALDEAGELASPSDIYTVKVEQGNYLLTNHIDLKSNTTLDLRGVTLKASGSDFNMLSSQMDDPKGGYADFCNAKIWGGTFVGDSKNDKTHMRLYHGDNVTLDGVTITGGNSNHMLEVAAINHFTVKNCTFKDMGKNKREAIQLDLAVSSSIYPNIILDGTMMKNVEITGCTFSNVSRGVGSHSILVGAYLDQIKITNNLFEHVDEECIIALNYHHAVISGNTMEDCGAGVLFQAFRVNATNVYTTIQDGAKKYKGKVSPNASSVIENNTIQTSYHPACEKILGIKLFGRKLTKAEKNKEDGGKIPAGNYYVSGVKVINNTIQTAGYGIMLENAKKSTVKGNKITGKGFSSKDALAKQKKYNGIHLGKESTDILIQKNTIKKLQNVGIFLQDSSIATTIKNNTIDGGKKAGIFVIHHSKVKKGIIGNTIKNVKNVGIGLYNGVTVKGGMKKNKISGPCKKKISISVKSKVVG